MKWIGVGTLLGASVIFAVWIGLQRQESSATATLGGRALYLEHCASCHGPNLEGQANWRQRNAEGFLPAPPHDASGHTWHHTDDVLFKITKLGTQAFVGDTYKSNMPGFGGQLTDEQVHKVIAYIKSTWPDNIRKIHEQRNAVAD